MSTIAVLGASGMLGSAVLEVLTLDLSTTIIATARSQELVDMLAPSFPGVEWRLLDAELADVQGIQDVIGDTDWVVNAIGVIKPYIHDDNAVEIQRAIRVNSLFPHLLALAAEKSNTRVLQIATDCAYSGLKGGYLESDAHDALDVYGKTKSLGEVYSDNVHHIRCSIIGPELKTHKSLLDWFLSQPSISKVNGFTNHEWNGVTTLHFGWVCLGIIKENIEVGHLQHVIPTGTISKDKLLECFAKEYDRQDIVVNPVEAGTVVDRTLTTENGELNKAIWAAAGYSEPPTVPQMVAEMAHFDYKTEGVRS